MWFSESEWELKPETASRCLPTCLTFKSCGHQNQICRVNCPCPEQRRIRSQLLSEIFDPILLTEPEDHDQTIHMVAVNGLIVTLSFYG